MKIVRCRFSRQLVQLQKKLWRQISFIRLSHSRFYAVGRCWYFCENCFKYSHIVIAVLLHGGVSFAIPKYILSKSLYFCNLYKHSGFVDVDFNINNFEKLLALVQCFAHNSCIEWVTLEKAMNFVNCTYFVNQKIELCFTKFLFLREKKNAPPSFLQSSLIT